MLKIFLYLIFIGIAAYIAACLYWKSAIIAAANNEDMEEVAPTKADYSILTLVFLIVGGLSIWGAKSLHYWLTTILCIIIAALACWFASRRQPISGCATVLIIMQALVELATFVPGENANLIFAIFALLKLILIILIAVFGLVVDGTAIRDANNRSKADLNQTAADALDKFKKALAKEGVKDGIIFCVLVVVALIILFKLVLPA